MAEIVRSRTFPVSEKLSPKTMIWLKGAASAERMQSRRREAASAEKADVASRAVRSYPKGRDVGVRRNSARKMTRLRQGYGAAGESRKLSRAGDEVRMTK